MSIKVDRLHVHFAFVRLLLGVMVGVVVSVSEEYCDEAAGKCLGEGDVHLVFFFEVNERAQSQRVWLECTRAHFRIIEGLRVETLLKLDQVDVEAARDLALEVDDFSRGH